MRKTITNLAVALGVAFVFNACHTAMDEKSRMSVEPSCKAKGVLVLYPTIECVGVTYAQYPDELKSGNLSLEWRVKGQLKWNKGPRLEKNPINKKLRASIFPLPKGVSVDVRVLNGKQLMTAKSVKLRPDQPGYGKVLDRMFVSPEGDDRNPGDKDSPLRTINKALAKASPGTEVIIKGGVYNEQVRITKSGKPGAYIVLRGARGERPLITGGVAFRDAVQWEKKGDLYSVPAKKAIYASIDGRRMYCYPSLEALKNEYDPAHESYFGRKSVTDIRNIYNAIPCAMAFDKKTKRMYFKVPAGTEPWNIGLEIAQVDVGILLKRVSYVRISNLYFTHFNNSAVKLTHQSHDNVIDNCEFKNVGSAAISVNALSYDNLIEHNYVEEREYGDWIWALRKATVHESSGISCWRAGGGNVIRYNRTDGTFNGIAVCSRMASQKENEVSDTDVYGNLCLNHGDDALEPEGAGVNNRIFNNRVFNSFVAISLAPINVGPTYVYRNLFVPTNVCFKLQNHMSPGMVLIYHNTCITEKGDGVVNHNRRNGFVDNMIFRNNIIQAGRYIVSGLYGNDYDNNLFYTTDSSRFVKAGKRNRYRLASLGDIKKKIGKPVLFSVKKVVFKKGKNKDFYPVGNADAVYDVGVLIHGFNDNYKGKGPDMGYREYQ